MNFSVFPSFQVCLKRDFAAASSKTVPFKHRCGVTDLNDIRGENYCRCVETDESAYENYKEEDRRGRGNGVGEKGNTVRLKN